MELWTAPITASVLSGAKNWHGYAATLLRTEMRKQGYPEEEIEEKVEELKSVPRARWSPGKAAQFKVLRAAAVKSVMEKEREAWKQEHKRLLAEGRRIFEEGKPGWQEKLDELNAKVERLREEWEKRRDELRGKTEGQGKGLGFTSLMVLQAPRWTKKAHGPSLKRNPRMIFGPWWNTPKTESFECELWKTLDQFYGTLPENLKTVLKDCMYDPKMSLYDHWMGFMMRHCLRGIDPAPYPFRLKEWPTGPVLARRAGMILWILAAAGFQWGDYILKNFEEVWAFLAKYNAPFAALGAGAALIYLMWPWYRFIPCSFSSRRAIFPHFPAPDETPPFWDFAPVPHFHNHQLYSAFVGIWSSGKPPYTGDESFVITITLRTACWQNSGFAPWGRNLSLVPTPASFGFWYITRNPDRQEYVYDESFVSNQDIYCVICPLGRVERIRIWYGPGLERPLSLENYGPYPVPRGVYASRGPPSTPGYPPSYALGEFDGIHAWVHWPWPMASTRYSEANPPDWWRKETIRYNEWTWYRVRPPHPYTGHRSLRPW